LNKFHYPERLIAGMNSRKLIPFAGAGVSKKAIPDHFPTWREFAAEMNTLAQSKGVISPAEHNEIRQLIRTNRLTFVMDLLKSALTQEDYEDLLTSRFEYVDISGANLNTQNLLLRIAGNVIITTNYDRLLEDTFARTFRRSPTSVTFEQSSTIQYSIQDHRRPKEPMIFKIHGDIKSKQSIILSERDYRSLMYDQQTYETVITSMFLNNVFLFVGFSLQDREVLYHLERLRHKFSYITQAHYALMPTLDLTDLEIKQFREAYGVEIIAYDPGDNHAAIDRFLTGALRRKTKGI